MPASFADGGESNPKYNDSVLGELIHRFCTAKNASDESCQDIYHDLLNTLTRHREDKEWLFRPDSVWQLRSAFAIMTMQSGFALLETGCVSAKNIANIMVKNIIDVTLGGFNYWLTGYGLSYGRPEHWFCGLGDFAPNIVKPTEMGSLFTYFFFQFSFASTATTIVSGSVAERMNLHGYMIYSVLNTLSYCIPASWVWSNAGFLQNRGFYDFAGKNL